MEIHRILLYKVCVNMVHTGYNIRHHHHGIMRMEKMSMTDLSDHWRITRELTTVRDVLSDL